MNKEVYKEVLWIIAIVVAPFVMSITLSFLYFTMMPSALIPISIFENQNVVNSVESTFLSMFVVLGIPFLYFCIVVVLKNHTERDIALM